LVNRFLFYTMVQFVYLVFKNGLLLMCLKQNKTNPCLQKTETTNIKYNAHLFILYIILQHKHTPLWSECFPLVSNYLQVFLTCVKSISQNVDILITATIHGDAVFCFKFGSVAVSQCTHSKKQNPITKAYPKNSALNDEFWILSIGKSCISQLIQNINIY
jgi:hypothetical protein